MKRIVAACSVFFCFPAVAADWYGGVLAGGAYASSMEPRKTVPGMFLLGTEEERFAESRGLMVGRRLAPGLALEARYVEHGGTTASIDTQFASRHNAFEAHDRYTRRISALGLDVVASRHLAGDWSAWASLGLVQRTVRTRLETATGRLGFREPSPLVTRATLDARDRSVAARAGIGLAHQATTEWSVRAGYEYLRGARDAALIGSYSEVRGASGVSALNVSVVRSFSPAPGFPARNQGWYAGFGGGAAWQDAHPMEVSPDFPGFGGFVVTRRHSERRTPVWSVLVGREVSRHFGIEARYSDYGQQHMQAVGIFAPAHPGAQTHTEQFRRHVRGVGLDLVARAPLAARWEAWGSLGLARMRVDTRLRLEATAPHFAQPLVLPYASRRLEHAGRAAVGLQYRPAPRWTLRAGYEYVDRVGNELAVKDPSTTGSSAISSAILSLMRVF